MYRRLLGALILSWLTGAFTGATRADEQQARVDAHGDPLPAGAMTRFGTARFNNGGQICGLAIAPNGKWIASEGGSGVVHLWNSATGEEIRSLKPPVAGWGPLAFSADGKRLASSAGGDMICLWDPATGRLLRNFVGPAQMVRSVAFSPDGRLLAAGAGDGKIFLWETESGKTLHILGGHRESPNGLVFTADGKALLSTGHDGTTRFWDAAAGIERWKVAPNPYESTAVVLTPDGKTAIAARGQGDGKGLIHYWDVATRKLLRVFPANKGGVLCMALSSDGKVLATGGYDRTVRLWNAETTAELGSLPTESDTVNHLDLSADGGIVTWGLFSGSRVRVARVTRLENEVKFKELLPPEGHGAGVVSVRYTGDGKKILSTSGGNDAILWDELSGKKLLRFHEGYCAALAPGGMLLALADVNDNRFRKITIHDTASGKEVGRIKADAQVYSMAFSANNRALIFGGTNGEIQVYELATGKSRMRLAGHRSHIIQILLAPDGHTLLSACYDSTRLWDTITGKELDRLPFKLRNRTMAFSRDGKLLAIGDDNSGAVVLWDIAEKRELRRIPSGIHEVVFMPDNQTLAAACMDDSVRLWEVSTGIERHKFTGHAGWITCLDIAPDGRTLVSGGIDTTLMLWTTDAFVLGKPVPAPRLSAKELRARCDGFPVGEWPQWWADLAMPDAVKAHRAIWGLATESKDILTVMQKWWSELYPTPVATLIAELGHDDFVRREKASAELARLGKFIEPPLRLALSGNLDPEARRRIERILAQRESGMAAGSDEGLRFVRAVEVLEHIGNADARNILTTLSKQAPADLAREAAVALERISKRP
jgi:WD40 repeat protein